MIIIAGYELVNARIGTATSPLSVTSSRVPAFDGCIHIAITVDSVDPERVDSVEVWRNAEALAIRRAHHRDLAPHAVQADSQVQVVDNDGDVVPSWSAP